MTERLVDWALQSAARKFGRAFQRRRGVAAKLAQFLSFEHPTLEAELAASFYRLPPLPGGIAWRILEEELGCKPRELFETLELQACAAASMGQVHRGILSGVGAVAVKIQYPSLADAVEHDIEVLDGLASWLPSRELLAELVEEIAERLREECDFEGEARRTTWFGDHLQIEGVRVPRVHAVASSPRVLTTDWVKGHHLDPWLATCPTREAADAAGRRVSHVLWKSLFVLHRVHSDLNPGNLLFGDRGSIGLIDFGSVKDLRSRLAEVIRDLLLETLNGNSSSAFKAAWNGGLLGQVDRRQAERLYRDVVGPFFEWIARPCAGTFDFGAARGLALSGRKKFLDVVRANPRTGIYRDLLFLNRTFYLSYSVLERLGARVNVREIIEEHVAKQTAALESRA